MQTEAEGSCMLCEEAPGYRPYPCAHLLCEQCLQRSQAERMYRCPFCRAKQQVAVPSLEFKLLKLLVGIPPSGVHVRDAVLDAARAVARQESGAVAWLETAVAEAVPHMVDFHAMHYEADTCIQLLTALLNGALSIEKLRGMIAGSSAPAQLATG